MLFSFGCSEKKIGKRGIHISFHTQPNTLDPTKASDFLSSTCVSLLYEGLTRCSKEGSVEPALLEHLEISKDQRVYTFYLRRAYWSDGKIITAFDFERSWKKIIEHIEPCVFLFYPIKNVEKYIRNEAHLDEVGILALNEKTFQVVLEKPTPHFYSLTAFPSFLPAPENLENIPTIFSGPFRLKKMVHCDFLHLEKNPVYWNKDNIALDEIKISIIPDEITALAMFEKNELDWIGGNLSPIPIDAFEKYENQCIFIPSSSSTLCTFNTGAFPFSNANLRKAFSFAIDREKIDKQLCKKKGHLNTFLPPSLSNQNFALSNETLAKKYLGKALNELDISLNDLEEIPFYYRGFSIEKKLAQILQDQWEKTLGIKIQLVLLDSKTHAQRLKNKEYEIALATWIAQFDDPVSLLDRFRNAQDLKNYSGWQNELYNQMLDLASNSHKREEYLHSAEKCLVEEMPVTPIYHWNSPALYSSKIKSYSISPCGGVLFEKFELNEHRFFDSHH